ncbi:MAG: glycosyltransferase, partial [Desulfovibrionales bacterium]
VQDTGCSLKIMNAEMLKAIPMYKGMHRFLPTLMKMEGARVAEVQVNHRSRQFGISKYGVWDRAFSAGYDLLAVRWMQKRHIRYEIKERK